MKTSLGDIAVCDAHAHFFSHRFFEVLASQKRDLPPERPVETMLKGLGWDEPPLDNTALAARWVEELDKHGLERIALMASVPGDEQSIADAVRAFPDRIHGYFMFDPLGPDAIARATRNFDELALQGLCLFPAMHRFSVQDERLYPLYELAAQRAGTIVFVHCGVLSVGVRKKLGLPSKFDMSRSNPIDLHRVAMEFPQVRFVIPHFGAGYFREALMLGDLVPNVYLDTSSTNSWIKYQMPAVTLEAAFDKAIEIYGAERILFGSDSSFFPRGWNAEILKTQLPVLSKLSLPPDKVAAILGGNLRALLAR